MRTGAPSHVLAGSAGYWPEISAWRGGTLLAGQIPAVRGRYVSRLAGDLPQHTLTITVPRFVDGVDWLPRADSVDHPLAPEGQDLVVKVCVQSDVSRQIYETRIGRFQIQSTEPNSRGEVIVTAAGVLQGIDDDRFAAPVAPKSSSTLISEFRRLMSSGVGVAVDPAINDRPCPESMEWSESRLEALAAIAAALPARLRVDANGQVQLLPPMSGNAPSVLTISEGERSPLNDYPVVVEAMRKLTRDGIFNAVTVRGAVTDDPSIPPVQATVEQTTGRYAVSTYRRKQAFYSSPLLTSEAQCLAAAQTRLESFLRPARVMPVELAPDPRLDIDDVVTVRADLNAAGEYLTEVIGPITGVDLPLTVADGPMRIDVAVRDA